MHPDMKTFSDITGINTRGRLMVELQIVHHGRTVDIITINGRRILRDNVNLAIDLFSPIRLSVLLLDFDEGTSGVEIKSFTVNGLDVLPKYQHCASNQNNYIDKSGMWTLDIPSPFYAWYHYISGQGFVA